jgi:hypothetical protein
MGFILGVFCYEIWMFLLFLCCVHITWSGYNVVFLYLLIFPSAFAWDTPYESLYFCNHFLIWSPWICYVALFTMWMEVVHQTFIQLCEFFFMFYLWTYCIILVYFVASWLVGFLVLYWVDYWWCSTSVSWCGSVFCTYFFWWCCLCLLVHQERGVSEQFCLFLW